MMLVRPLLLTDIVPVAMPQQPEPHLDVSTGTHDECMGVCCPPVATLLPVVFGASCPVFSCVGVFSPRRWEAQPSPAQAGQARLAVAGRPPGDDTVRHDMRPRGPRLGTRNAGLISDDGGGDVVRIPPLRPHDPPGQTSTSWATACFGEAQTTHLTLRCVLVTYVRVYACTGL